MKHATHKYTIDLFEPSVDPGGYTYRGITEASSLGEALSKIITEANQKYPTNLGWGMWSHKIH